MLAVFDSYDDATKELIRSLEAAEIPLVPVLANYDGELPEGALCPFVTYTGLELSGRPLFFNEVPVPRWCEIRQGPEVYGEILRDGELLGRINYEPNSFRQVESVDWLLPDRSRSHTDRYDRYGNRYAATYYAAGAAYQTVHSGPGEWELVVDHGTRTVTMRSRTRLHTFARLADLVSHFIDDQSLDDDEVLINSLSHPLFVTRKRAERPNTTLFWQEPMPAEVPENMDTELQHPKALERVVFGDVDVLQRVREDYPDTPVALSYLSPLGQFTEKRDYDLRRVFTLTHSDDLAALVELLRAFPEVTFSVAAVTLMSQRLHDLERQHPNLVLSPGITQGRIRDELEQASVYLDINAGAQVLDVVKAAYYLDLVVLALASRAKAPDHSLVVASVDELKAELEAATATPRSRGAVLARLHTQRGPRSTGEDYRRTLARSGDVESEGSAPTAS